MFPSMRKSVKMVSHLVGVGMLCLFFAFHTFAGDTGWLAKKEIERHILLVKAELAALRKNNQLQRHRIQLLQSNEVDADMLAEVARAKVGLFGANDVIITIPVGKL